jgi:hypothetical protein
MYLVRPHFIYAAVVNAFAQAKRVAIAATVGVLQAWPRTQITIIFAVGGAYAMWTSLVRPFKDEVDNQVRTMQGTLSETANALHSPQFYAFMEWSEVVQSLFLFLLLQYPQSAQLATGNLLIVALVVCVFIVLVVRNTQQYKSWAASLKRPTDQKQASADIEGFEVTVRHFRERRRVKYPRALYAASKRRGVDAGWHQAKVRPPCPDGGDSCSSTQEAVRLHSCGALA